MSPHRARTNILRTDPPQTQKQGKGAGEFHRGWRREVWLPSWRRAPSRGGRAPSRGKGPFKGGRAPSRASRGGGKRKGSNAQNLSWSRAVRTWSCTKVKVSDQVNQQDQQVPGAPRLPLPGQGVHAGSYRVHDAEARGSTIRPKTAATKRVKTTSPPARPSTTTPPRTPGCTWNV